MKFVLSSHTVKISEMPWSSFFNVRKDWKEEMSDFFFFWNSIVKSNLYDKMEFSDGTLKL